MPPPPRHRTSTSNRPGASAPMSERQQMALLMQMTSTNEAELSPNSQSSKPKDRNERGETALHICAKKGDFDGAKKLLEQGTNPNVTDFAGWTPLHEATNHGHYHLAQLLIKHGANVNATGLDDITPLHDAASFGNQKLVKMLLDKGADPQFKNKKGKTAQDLAHPSLVNFFANLNNVTDCKGVITWSNLNIVSNEVPQLPEESAAVYRTYIFAIVYLALYSALIFTSLYSLCGIENSCLGRKSFPIFFGPWIFVCCSIVVMDVLATTYYIMDSISTASTDGLLDLLEIGNPQTIGSVLEQLAAQWRFLPPIMMFLVTSKGFVFLIMDIVVITMIIKAGWSASTYHKYVDETVRNYTANLARNNLAYSTSQTDVTQKDDKMEPETTAVQHIPLRDEQPETPDRYNDTSRDNNVRLFVYPDRVNNGKTKEEKQNSIPRPNTMAVARQNSRQNSQNDDVDREIENRLSHYTASNGSVIRSTEPLKDENISERQQQPTRIRVLPAVAEINRRSSQAKEKPKVPPKPQNRVSMQPWVEDRTNERPDSQNSGAKVDRTSSMNAPEELRGQLPWSYFKARDDVPKKAFTELKEDEDLPPVPIPDYTLHFPKNRRPNMSDSDGENSWSRYDQRY